MKKKRFVRFAENHRKMNQVQGEPVQGEIQSRKKKKTAEARSANDDT